MNMTTQQPIPPLHTLIVTGPQGCGKTRRAHSIAAHFRLSAITDDWDGLCVPTAGGLLLTSISPAELNAGDIPVMTFDEVDVALSRPPLLP